MSGREACQVCGADKPAGRGRRTCSERCRLDARNAKERARVAAIRQKVWAHKESIGCFWCGYHEHGAALDWHHPDDNKERRLTIKTYFTPLGVAERAKCELVCANCHRVHHADEKIAANGDVWA